MHEPLLFLSAEAERLGTARELRRRAYAGHLVRVRRGVYVDAAAWASLDGDERYLTLVRSAALVSAPDSQFSRESAAVLWGLPMIGSWPTVAHELVDPRPGGTSRVGIRRHALGLDPSAVTTCGVTHTSLSRTLVDVACALPFGSAVPMLDAGLRMGAERTGLREILDALLPYPGATRGRRALEFASPLSESPGESFTRVQCHALGLPPPQLQVPFSDARGLIGYADFYWPHLDLVVEFDGASKYSAHRLYQRTVTLEELVLAEKDREDRMRRVVKRFVRLRWPVVKDRRLLAQRLMEEGLVRGREPIPAR